MRVDVYRNLNDGCLSIRSRDTASDDYGRVIDHADTVLLDDPDFIVQESGRDLVRQTGVKNVHAMVRGSMVSSGNRAMIDWMVEKQISENDVCIINYDPYEMDMFEVTKAEPGTNLSVGDTIESAMYSLITTDGVRAMFKQHNS